MLKTVTQIAASNGTVTLIQGNGTVNGITLTGNVTTSGNITCTLSNVTNAQLQNSSVIIGNTTVALGSTVTSLGNLTVANVTITSGTINVQTTNHTASVSGNATYGTSSLLLVPQGFLQYDLNGTVVKIPYYAV